MYTVWPFKNAAPLSNSLVAYIPLFAPANNPSTLSESGRQIYVPVAMTLSAMYLDCVTAPGAGKSYTYTIRKNGVDTTLTATVSDTNTTASVTGQAVVFAAGDLISLSSTPSGTPTSPGIVYGQVLVNSASQPIAGYWYGSSVFSNNSTRYLAPSGGFSNTWSSSSTESDISTAVPIAGTIKNLYVNRYSSAPSSGQSCSYTLMVNGVASALTLTISDTATTGSDTTHSVSVNAGDLISIRCAGSASAGVAGSGSISMAFTPSDGASSIYMTGNHGNSDTSNIPSQTVTGYRLPFGGAGLSNQSTDTAGAIGSIRINRMYITMTTAPGSGKSWSFTLRENSVDTALTATVSNTGTTVTSTSGTVVTQPFGRYSVSLVPVSTPASPGNVRISVSGSFVPPSNFFIMM